MKEVNDHSFSVNAAKSRGHEKAILLKEIYGWVKHNWDGQRNIHHGVAWTYSSAKVYQEKFPYFSERSISRWLSELEKEGFIASANFNEHKYDRTKWYTINVDAYLGICSNCDPDYLTASLNAFLKFFSKLATSKRQNGEGLSHDGEGLSHDGEPIPSLSFSLTSPNLYPPSKNDKLKEKKIIGDAPKIILQTISSFYEEVKTEMHKGLSKRFEKHIVATVLENQIKEFIEYWTVREFRNSRGQKIKSLALTVSTWCKNGDDWGEVRKMYDRLIGGKSDSQNGQIRYSKEEKISPMKYDRVLPTPKINRV